MNRERSVIFLCLQGADDHEIPVDEHTVQASHDADGARIVTREMCRTPPLARTYGWGNQEINGHIDQTPRLASPGK